MLEIASEQRYLANGGVGLLIDLTSGDPVVVHWGADLGSPVPDAGAFTDAVARSSFDLPVRPSIAPQSSRGWLGRPAVRGSRDGHAFSPLFVLAQVSGGDADLHLQLEDESTGLRLQVAIELTPSGLLLTTSTLTNVGDTSYLVGGIDAALPIPDQAVEALDTTGRWAREKHPQRRRIDQGLWVRGGRHGRTGHDATAVLAAGTAGFGWGTGEVWAVHLGWSGDSETFLERLRSGQGVLGGGELLQPGEIVLAPGESLTTPTLYAAYSAAGLDGISARFHDWMRARPHHPSTPRPVVLNTWEAVYFDHRLQPLLELADTAAELGVERFVLDDGWFTHRRHDRAGLGDWTVDAGVWPQGLGPLIDHVHGLGMQFGLWVEPEMINSDSDLARAHPDWISGPGGRQPLEWRNQQVLDIANPEAAAHILGALDALLTEYRIDYFKWDQNRDQPELGSAGRASSHDQTLAIYALLDELHVRHPGLEIESCSSGGARVDLGILQRTERLWASDSNDALERQTIQRWTELLVPPELVGAHVGPTVSHTSGRVHAISFRVLTAMLGSFGIEWDVRTATADDRRVLTEGIAFYKRYRGLLHSGRMVRLDSPDPTLQTTGVVSVDRSQAVFIAASLASGAAEIPPRLRLRGLDPARTYRVELGLPIEPHSGSERAAVPWLQTGLTTSGAALQHIGVPMPMLFPEHALVLTVEAIA